MPKHDGILGFYMNPYTSGIAKFNTMLAERLAVPYLPVFDGKPEDLAFPVLSFKGVELDHQEVDQLNHWLDRRKEKGLPYAFFFHVYNELPIEERIAHEAAAVYCGNSELHKRLERFNPNCLSLSCPGTIMEQTYFKPTELKILTFGMAHKIRARRYLKLKELLDKTGMTYSIYMSTAMHASTDFFEALRVTREEMHELFGENIYFMGYLSDLAVYNYLEQCHYLVAFFENGIRANNTSVNAALGTGAVVITNLDEHSPADMEHGRNIIDIDQSETLITDPHQLKEIGVRARRLGLGSLGWDALCDEISGHEVTT